MNLRRKLQSKHRLKNPRGSDVVAEEIAPNDIAADSDALSSVEPPISVDPPFVCDPEFDVLVSEKLSTLFRQNTYLQNKKHTLTCQRWDWLLQI